MKDVWRKNKGRKLAVKFLVLLGLASLAMALAFGSTMRTAKPVVQDSMDKNAQELPLSKSEFLDPFSLSTIVLARESSPNGNISFLNGTNTGTPIWIPYRPALRSPVQPLFVYR